MSRTPYAPHRTTPEPDDDSVRPAVLLDHVSKVYGDEPVRVRALDDVTVGFDEGSFTAVMGPSGSGKSSLLHCAAGLERPSSGTVLIEQTDLGGLDETALTRWRRRRVGFVFQAYNLLPFLTVAQNVTLPLELDGKEVDAAAVQALLASLGIDQRSGHLPAQLSGGQQQRVALARAIVTGPAVVFADEPTGALDTGAATEVLGLLRRTVDDLGCTIVMVTHDPAVASYADAVVFLADGKVDGTLTAPTVEQVMAQMAHLGDRSRR